MELLWHKMNKMGFDMHDCGVEYCDLFALPIPIKR